MGNQKPHSASYSDIGRKISALFVLLPYMVFSQSPLTFSTKPQKGLGIIAKDSLFSMQIQFRIQNRAAMLTVSDRDLSPDSYEFRVRRARLKFEGFVASPKLTYKLQLSFARGDMDWSGTDFSRVNTSVNIVRDAVIYYAPNEHWKFGFGQTKLPGNRQRVVSSGDQQFADRSIVNATFTLDRDFGFNAVYTRNYFNISAAVSSGEGRNSSQSSSGLAYTGRIEVLPFGRFTGKNDYIEGDLEREQKPKVSLGASYSYNQHALRAGGTLGYDLAAPTDLKTLSIDGVLKYRGFSLYGEFMARDAQSPITYSPDTTLIVPVYVGYGFLAQAGYLFKSNWEVAARFAQITPFRAVYENAFGVNEKQQQHIQLGVTRYIYGHRVKVQGNLLYHLATDMKESETTGRYGAIFQVELGI
jgi:phosphate-selective porin OprO and OprP